MQAAAMTQSASPPMTRPMLAQSSGEFGLLSDVPEHKVEVGDICPETGVEKTHIKMIIFSSPNKIGLNTANMAMHKVAMGTISAV